IANAPQLDAARVKRMRARRALGFRAATVNVHETDFLTLRRLGLLGVGHHSREEIDNALDVFLAAALATAAEEIREPVPASDIRDPRGLHSLRPFLTRLASLVRAYST